MILPKHPFQKLLDSEISTDQFQNQLQPETLKRWGILSAINIVAFFFVAKYWTETGSWKVGFIPGFLVVVGIYLALGIVFGSIMLRNEKKRSGFLVEALEEEKQKTKKISNSKTELKVKVPAKAGKFYLSGKISKLSYIHTVFSFHLSFIRGLFFVSFGGAFLLFWLMNADFITKVASSYLSAFIMTFIFGLKLADIYFKEMEITLYHKQKQHEAFDHAENSPHS